MNKLKAPFPWFGGKSDAASAVWAAIGDCHHYVEPFAGSLAVLLLRPHEVHRTYYSETVNDADLLLVNFWRALRAAPDEVAEHCSYPVSEVDMHARHLWLLPWRETARDMLCADPEAYDAKAAGWWVYGQCCAIAGWCSGDGPWIIRDGKLYKQSRAKQREPGISTRKPHLADDGKGVHTAAVREHGVGHELVMPKLTEWLRFLSSRLRHVRILSGDWSRVCTNGVTKTFSVRKDDAVCGVFLDPPYSEDEHSVTYAAGGGGGNIASDVRAWCVEHGADPKLRIVLAGYSGEHEELAALGWHSVEWFKKGFLKGGYAQAGKNGSQQHRERLWLSPHCLRPLHADAPVNDRQQSMFDEVKTRFGDCFDLDNVPRLPPRRRRNERLV